jgi:hypothetical protein
MLLISFSFNQAITFLCKYCAFVLINQYSTVLFVTYFTHGKTQSISKSKISSPSSSFLLLVLKQEVSQKMGLDAHQKTLGPVVVGLEAVAEQVLSRMKVETLDQC